MADGEELEFQRQNRPGPIGRKSDKELAKHFMTLLAIDALLEILHQLVYERPGSMLKEREK